MRLEQTGEFWKKYNERIFLLLIIAFAFLLRLLLLLNTHDFHGISAGRVLLTELMLKNKGLPLGLWYDPVHPPLHLLLLFLGLKALNSPFLVPRLISLLFGMLMFIPFYLFNKFFFGKKTALFSLLAVAIYSEHVVYSVIATSETCYAFFIFLAFWLYVLSLNKNKPEFLLALSGISIGLASLSRYEGLLFIPLMTLFLRKDLKRSAVFFLTAMILPLIWMAVNYKYSGDPFRFITTNDFTVPLQYNWIRSQGIAVDLMRRIFYWPGVLIETLGGFVFFLGLGGLGYCAAKRTRVFPAAAFLLILGVFIAGTAGERVYLQPRYSILPGLLLIPFSFFIFLKLIAFLKTKIKFIPVAAALLLIAGMIPAIGQRVLAEPLFIPFFARDIASYIGKNMNHGENIFLDQCGDEKYREPIKLLSGINPRQFVVMPYLVPKGGRWVADKAKFFALLRKNNVRFLVYSPAGDLGKILALEKKGKETVMEGFKFTLCYKDSRYYVYRVERSADD